MEGTSVKYWQVMNRVFLSFPTMTITTCSGGWYFRAKKTTDYSVVGNQREHNSASHEKEVEIGSGKVLRSYS